MTPGSQAAALERGGLRPATWGRGPWPHRAHVPSPPSRSFTKGHHATATPRPAGQPPPQTWPEQGPPCATTEPAAGPELRLQCVFFLQAQRLPGPHRGAGLPCPVREGRAELTGPSSRARQGSPRWPLAGGGAAPPAGSRLRATRNQGSRGGWPPARPSRTPAPCLDGLSGRLVARRATGRWPDPTPPPVPAVKLSSTWPFRQAYSPPP